MTAARRGLAALGRVRELGLAGFVALLVVVVAVQSGSFLSGDNLRSLLLDTSLIAVIACAQLAVLLTRSFDLTVGSTLGVCAMTVGMIFKSDHGFPVELAFVLAVAIGLLIGVLNGMLIAWLRIPSIILTLGMLSVLRGVVYAIAQGTQVNPFDVPNAMTAASLQSAIWIPVTVVMTVLVAAAAFYVLRWTRTGRSIYALGSNPEAAVLHGLSTRRLTILVFALSGAAAGLAGAMYVSRFGFVQPTAGTGEELIVVAAVVVGGASIFGGSGSVGGTLLGALILGVVANGLNAVGISSYWQYAATGALILVAVLIDRAAARRGRAAATSRARTRAA